MEKKIKWTDGMEIVLDVFEQSDKYHQFKLQELGKLLASERYGLVAGEINITPLLDELKVFARNLYAFTPQGTMMVVDVLEQTISIHQDGYILIKPKGNKVTEIEGISYEIPLYDCICTTDVTEGIIIGKICNGHFFETYIPPSYRLDACDKLKRVYKNCTDFLPYIEMKLKEKKEDRDSTLFELLKFELCQYNLRESPKEFYVLLAKIAYCLHKLHPEPPLPQLVVFDEMNIGDAILPIMDFIRKYYHELDNISEPKKEEVVEVKKEGRVYKF